MKFCVFTDLHYDVIPDGDRRIYELIQECKRKKAEFAVELGDLCNPTKENHRILDLFIDAGISCYHSIWNHNTDFSSSEKVLSFLGLKEGYYSIIRDNIKFIFLDPNHIRTESDCTPECNANLTASSDKSPYIPKEQIEWLKSEIADENYFYIICSHQSLCNDFMVGNHSRGIVNREAVRKILEERNSLSRKILFCINGNDHGDDVKLINGIYYYSLNSASYIWHGVKEMYNYSKEVHDKYPYLKDMILYEEPLHVIITIDENTNVEIEGMKGHYQNVTPEDIGIADTWNGVSIRPHTSSLKISASSV